jgi:hypothetical protein
VKVLASNSGPKTGRNGTAKALDPFISVGMVERKLEKVGEMGSRTMTKVSREPIPKEIGQTRKRKFQESFRWVKGSLAQGCEPTGV